jgi:hypothetical protein
METDELIKLIIGAVVVVLIIIGVSLFFKNQVIDFFKGLSTGNKAGIFLALIK